MQSSLTESIFVVPLFRYEDYSFFTRLMFVIFNEVVFLHKLGASVYYQVYQFIVVCEVNYVTFQFKVSSLLF